MFSLLPQFHYHSCQDGSKVLRLGYTEEAKRLLKQRKGNPPPRTTSLPPSLVRQKAIEALTRLGGDCTNELQVLGQHEVQFGVFCGKTFSWILNNALGYSGYIVDKVVNVDKERETEAALSKNKFIFKSYIEQFKQGIEAVQNEKERKKENCLYKNCSSCIAVTKEKCITITNGKKARASGRSVHPAVQPNIPSPRSSTVRTTTPTTKSTTSTTTVSTTKSTAAFATSRSTATDMNTTVSILSAADTTSVTLIQAQEELTDSELLAVAQPMSLSYAEGRPIHIVLNALT